MNDIALSVKGLSKSFGNVCAVRGIDFVLKRGRIMAFLGKNGAGKTTTIKAVLGFIKMDSGEVDIKIDSVGYVPEQPVFFPWMRGEDLLRCTARFYGVTRSRQTEQTKTWSEKLSFDPALLNRKVESYSQGNRKKFAYLQSLLISPELLIVDEPFSSLDPVSIRGVREIFRELGRGGTTLFLSSHLIAEIEKIYDDVLMIRNGEIALQRTRKELGPWADLENIFIASAA